MLLLGLLLYCLPREGLKENTIHMFAKMGQALSVDVLIKLKLYVFSNLDGLVRIKVRDS